MPDYLKESIYNNTQHCPTQACFQAGEASGKVASVMDQAIFSATYSPTRPQERPPSVVV
jgi:hypothetical protein